MGRRGPAPTPTETLKRRGSKAGKARAKSEPESSGRPRRPRTLTPGARRIWETLIPRLDEMGILGSIDIESLALFCENYAQWQKLIKLIDSGGMTYSYFDQGGQEITKIRPEVGQAQKLSETCLRLMNQFGMTPAARASLAMGTPKKPTAKKPTAKQSAAKGYGDRLTIAS